MSVSLFFLYNLSQQQFCCRHAVRIKVDNSHRMLSNERTRPGSCPYVAALVWKMTIWLTTAWLPDHAEGSPSSRTPWMQAGIQHVWGLHRGLLARGEDRGPGSSQGTQTPPTRATHRPHRWSSPGISAAPPPILPFCDKDINQVAPARGGNSLLRNQSAQQEEVAEKTLDAPRRRALSKA